MLDIQMLQMSNQKYRRTNFDEEENSAADITSPSELPSPAANFDPTVRFQQYKLNFWRRRSSLEKCLGLIVICLLFIIIVLAIVVQSIGKYKSPTMCTSKSCVTVASSILSSIDESVDPCQDFYQFACGNWIATHPIPAGHSKWDAFGILRESNFVTLKKFLDTPINESKSESEVKVKNYYISCMDPSNLLEKLGAEPLQSLVSELGGWPISETKGMKWDEENWNFQTAIKNFHVMGMNAFFSMQIGEDEKEPTRNIIKFDQIISMLGRDSYLNKTIKNDRLLAAYYKFMVDIGVLLGGEENNTKSLMLDVFEFEKAMVELTTPVEDKRDDEKNYNKMNVSQLQEMAPFMNWVDFLNSLGSLSNLTFNESEEVLVYSTEFLSQLSILMTDTMKGENYKKTLQNYMVWNLVQLYSGYLSKPFRAAKRDFMKAYLGMVGEEERWRVCVSETDNILGFALGAMFVKEKFQKDSKSSAETMINNIKHAFIANLPNLKWMDDETRKAAIEKAKAVVDKIGYPDYILNSTSLDMKYHELKINDSEFLMNTHRASLIILRTVLEKLRQPPEKSSWSMTPPTVNAYYTPVKNEIVFPAGILQAPFYDKDFPKSLNYGAVGVVMGHELTHGFDDQGREYDKSGVLRLWWNQKSIQEFQIRAKCMIDQYSNYTANGEHLRGKLTLGENIADNGGLKSAFNAYTDLMEKSQHEEPFLPGLSYSHKQLFFIAFAQVWCTTSTAVDISLAITTDTHSLPNFRVIGSVSNLPEFSEQFNCPLGSPMNPVNKCEVW